ncbi:hypothetical protein V8G54_013348 [Vigna mungo]|uniref:Uncharacterized protein n=1 Tax=Vigna mungo TaxID=3915 RepID=A0AAQ3S370_VIGMU
MHHQVKHLLTTSKHPQSQHAFDLSGIQPFGLATIRPHRFRLLGDSSGTPGPRTSFSSTGKFSRNSWTTDDHSRLLGSSPGTPGPRTTNLVYWEVLQELLGHEQPISSTGMFSRNSWATDDHSRLLRGSLGTPGPQTVKFVYWEVLQELLGHGRSFSSTGMFSRKSWATDDQFRLLGSSPGTPGPYDHSRLLGGSLGTPGPQTATDDHSCLLGGSPGTPRPQTNIHFKVHDATYKYKVRATNQPRLFNIRLRYLHLSTRKATERSKLEDHRTTKIANDRATQTKFKHQKTVKPRHNRLVSRSYKSTPKHLISTQNRTWVYGYYASVVTKTEAESPLWHRFSPNQGSSVSHTALTCHLREDSKISVEEGLPLDLLKTKQRTISKKNARLQFNSKFHSIQSLQGRLGWEHMARRLVWKQLLMVIAVLQSSPPGFT